MGFNSGFKGLILSPLYTYVFQMVSFPLGFPNKTLYAPLLSPLLATCPTHLVLLDMISRIMFVAECKWGSFWSYNFLRSSLVPLRPECQAVYFIIQRPWPLVPATLFPPSFKPIQRMRENKQFDGRQPGVFNVLFHIQSTAFYITVLWDHLFKWRLWGTSYVQLFAFVLCISKPRYLQESENFMKWLALVSGKKSLWTAQLNAFS